MNRAALRSPAPSFAGPGRQGNGRSYGRGGEGDCLALGRHFALIDANSKVIKRIPIPEPKMRGSALLTFERRLRAEFGVDDVALFLRDSELDEMP